jgi:hypothetical protein
MILQKKEIHMLTEFTHPRDDYWDKYPDLIVFYERLLASVIRFKDPNFVRLRPKCAESDLKHTNSTLQRFNDFLRDCPQNYQYLEEEIKAVKEMLYLHEAGEPVAGDTPLSIQDFRTIDSLSSIYVRASLLQQGKTDPTMKEVRELFARAEHLLFRRYGLKFVPPELRDRVKKTYFRFEKPNENDPAAQLAKIFDVLDGNNTAFCEFQNRNPDNGIVSAAPNEEGAVGDAQRLAKAVKRYIDIASVPDEVVEETLFYFANEAKIFIKYGYPTAYEAFEKEIFLSIRASKYKVGSYVS